MLRNHRMTQPVRGTKRLSALAAAIAFSLLLSSPASAQGGFNGPGRYEITNLGSGKVLDLDRNNRASVIQLASDGTSNQVWEIRDAGGGFYSLRNVMNGRALEAVGNRNSTPVRATAFDGRSGQQWRFDEGNDGNALIVSRLGKTLDIPNGTTEDGALVQIHDRNGDSNQQFRLRPVGATLSAGSIGSARSNNVSRNAVTATVSKDAGDRTTLKPGWNMFSPAQDVELGQQASGEVSRQVLMLNDSRVDNYLNGLGLRLAANAPGYKFPYAYQTVNDKGINAFALPGGHIYINRGVLEAADTEAQLAGVMAHETAHVALRHGTNQASKSSAAQMPLAILGGLLGSNSAGAALAQLGAGFTVNSILLKYSRDAESQADILGTQILFDTGLDPRAMGQFFQKIQGGSGVAFFSDHPNPDRRIETVNEEVARLGGSPRNSGSGSQEFAQIKRYVQSLPAPRPNQMESQQQQQNAPVRPEGTSDRLLTFENSVIQISHPDNWQAYGQGDAVTIAPRGGLVADGNGNQAMAYGVVVNIYAPHSERYSQQLQGPPAGQGAGIALEEATDQLVTELRQSNRNMRVVRGHERIDVGGLRGLSTYLSNDPPIQGSGRETNWLVTFPRPEGLLFLVFTAPEREFRSYENTFQQMLYSLRVRQ